MKAGAVYIFFKRFGQKPFKLNKLSNEFCFINLVFDILPSFSVFCSSFHLVLSGNYSSQYKCHLLFVLSFQRLHFLVSDERLFGPNNSWNLFNHTNKQCKGMYLMTVQRP